MSRVLSSSLAVLSALLCALLGSATLVVVAPAAHADGPLRVLLTGDSITHGRHGDYTWRYRLAKEFQRQGVPVNFVGSRTTPYVDPGYATASYADPNFDHDHFARAGATLQSMVGEIGPEVSTQQPDLVVLEAGLNDLLKGRTPEQTALSLRAWIANVRSARPGVTIVLAKVMRVDVAGGASVNSASASYNNQMADVAAEMTTPVSPISIADTDRGWQPTSPTYCVDGIHLAPTGETLVAQRVAEALHALTLPGHTGAVLPLTPSVLHYVSWTRTLKPVVRLNGTQATVSWSRQAITGARIRLQRVGRAAVTSVNPYTAGSHTFTLVKGATYDFRLQLVRNRLTGPWGPVTRVRVPRVLRPGPPGHVKVNASGVHWTAAARATSYVVKFHKAHQRRWTTRRTTGLQVLVAHVAVAKVRAVNASGRSPWRVARR